MISRCAWLGIVGLILLAGCVSTRHLDSAYAGRTSVYEPGEPNFDMVATATLRDGEPGIDCYLGIPRASLVFTPEDSVYTAPYETLLRLMDRKGKTILEEVVDRDTMQVMGYAATQVFDQHIKQRRITVEPGEYVLEVVLRDQNSQSQAERRRRVEVVAPGSMQPAVSDIRLDGLREGGAFEPVVSLHVPAGLDSMRMTVELYNASRLGDVQVTMRLLRFESDTSAAVPPYQYQLSPAYFLIRYNQADTLQFSRRTLRNIDDEVIVEFDLPGLEAGMYRVEMFARREGAPPTIVLQRSYDFAVRSPTFPRISTLDEMIEALAYLATDKKRETIQAANTPVEKKRRFDAFWGSLVPQRTRATNTLKLYYARVEEANLLYTTYKEGWKTDRGMVYIILGSPLYVDTMVDREVWYYSYNDNDPLHTFVFERRRMYESGGLFEAYLLRRNLQYEHEWRWALERWLRGDML
ncbi:MAG TPA: GWxTD domain-containing protein [Rhodothermales bacterium]|nr:GWxTD domain-containing protein [Rhodothermales bacterium]